MKFKANRVEMLSNSSGDLIVQLIINEYEQKRTAQYGYTEVKDINQLSVEVKKYRNKRSLSANAYMWKLIYEIAVKLNTDKDSVYLKMLKRYGVFTYITANKKAVERIKEQWRTIEIVDEKQMNGHDIVKILCYFGSSTYDTKEMSALIEGVVSEAKELGIETLDELEQKEMIRKYEEEQK